MLKSIFITSILILSLSTQSQARKIFRMPIKERVQKSDVIIEGTKIKVVCANGFNKPGSKKCPPSIHGHYKYHIKINKVLYVKKAKLKKIKSMKTISIPFSRRDGIAELRKGAISSDTKYFFLMGDRVKSLFPIGRDFVENINTYAPKEQKERLLKAIKKENL